MLEMSVDNACCRPPHCKGQQINEKSIREVAPYGRTEKVTVTGWMDIHLEDAISYPSAALAVIIFCSLSRKQGTLIAGYEDKV